MQKTSKISKVDKVDKVGSIFILLALLIFFTAIFPGYLIYWMEDLGVSMLAAGLIAMQGSIVLLFLSLFGFKFREIKEVLKQGLTLKQGFMALGFTVLIIFINIAVGTINSSVNSNDFVGTADQLRDTNNFILSVFFPVVFAPIFEELSFRAGFKRLLMDKGGYSATFYVIVSTIVFGILHMQSGQEIAEFTVTGSVGLVCAILYLKTKTIYVPILVHVFYNLIVMTAAFS